MNILWVNEVAEPTGGCEKYIADTATLLKHKGITNSFLYCPNSPTDTDFLKTFDYSFPMVDLARQVEEIKPDLIYVHRLSGGKQLEELIGTKIPVIRFFHDHKLFCLREHKYTTLRHKTCVKPIGYNCYSCLGFINRKDGLPLVRLRRLSEFVKEQTVNKKLAGFIVGSDYMKKHLIAHSFDGGKIFVNPLYTTDKKTVSQSERKNFLFAGQLVRGKGLDCLLNAFAGLNTSHKLIICGSGRQEQKYRQLADKLSLQEKIVWKGKLPSKQLNELYASSICAVMPSISPETFGLSGLEAMSNSTAVIASDVGGISQWLQDGVNGYLVPSGDSIALRGAMQRIADNTDIAKQLGAGGRKIFEAKFQPQAHIDKLIEIFSNFTNCKFNGERF